jgi:2,3-bisphosphoglycerate-dependent phosphoglycerate mutase
MITSIYFVRHAESDPSIKVDSIRPLTKKGLEDTKKVTKLLKDRNISLIYSSPYKRTIETVQDISACLGLDISIINDFRERKVGEWVEDFQTYTRNQWNDFDYRLSNGESLREVQERNISALLEIIKENQGKNIIIATHGTALCTIINYFQSDFGFDDFWNIAARFPYIISIQFEANKLRSIEELEIDRII